MKLGIERKIIILIPVILVVLLIITVVVFFKQGRGSTLDNVKIRYASVPAIVEAPAHVAYGKGFFLEEGLDVDLKLNQDGKTSLEQLFQGEVDIASAMATPVVYESFIREDFLIIGKIDHYGIHSIVANKDSGIVDAESIKGKKVAVMLGTSGQYFMDSWLLFNGIKQADIEILDYNGPDSVQALKAGLVDVIFCWFPFPVLAEQELGDKAVFLDSDEIVPGSWVIVINKDYFAKNQDIAKRFLRAIMKSVKFIEDDADAAMRIHSEISGVHEELVRNIFNQMLFRLTLDQVLLMDLESQARWVIKRALVNDTEIPNYLNFISTEPLQTVNPNAMTLIERTSGED